MKYALHHASPAIIWPGFHIETKTVAGAAKLAEELNRLDKDMNDWAVECHKAQAERDGLRKELDVQIEAKNNALRKVTDLEALGVELELRLKGSVTNRALKQRLGVRTGQVSELLNVLEAAQGILARYVEPGHPMKARYALTGLLDILDDGELVSMMRNLRELIGVKDNGSVELTKEQKKQVLSALDNLAMAYPWGWPRGMRDNYENACRILGTSEDGDVANGKQYLSGFGLGVDIEQPFTVQADRVYINGRLVLDGITPTIGLVAEPTERVVNNTTNHFGPKASKKELKQLRKAVEYFEEYADEKDPLNENVKAAKHLRKLLKKLS